MLKKLSIIILILATLSVWLVPKENDYVARIANDYGYLHSGAQLTPAQLKKVISYQFNHHLFYSEFICTYGDISVKYHGFFSMIFYVESTDHKKKQDIIVMS